MSHDAIGTEEVLAVETISHGCRLLGLAARAARDLGAGVGTDAAVGEKTGHAVGSKMTVGLANWADDLVGILLTLRKRLSSRGQVFL